MRSSDTVKLCQTRKKPFIFFLRHAQKTKLHKYLWNLLIFKRKSHFPTFLFLRPESKCLLFFLFFFFSSNKAQDIFVGAIKWDWLYRQISITGTLMSKKLCTIDLTDVDELMYLNGYNRYLDLISGTAHYHTIVQKRKPN